MRKYIVLTLEILSVLLIAGMLINLAVSWATLPNQIPVHYNIYGEIDRWGGKAELLLIPLIAMSVYALLTVIGFFPKLWNVPVKITESNKEQVYRVTKTLLLVIKAECILLFFSIFTVMLSSKPVPFCILPITIFVLFATLIVFMIKLNRL